MLDYSINIPFPNVTSKVIRIKYRNIAAVLIQIIPDLGGYICVHQYVMLIFGHL
jgi:hypothetical protein